MSFEKYVLFDTNYKPHYVDESPCLNLGHSHFEGHFPQGDRMVHQRGTLVDRSSFYRGLQKDLELESE